MYVDLYISDTVMIWSWKMRCTQPSWPWKRALRDRWQNTT